MLERLKKIERRELDGMIDALRREFADFKDQNKKKKLTPDQKQILKEIKKADRGIDESDDPNERDYLFRKFLDLYEQLKVQVLAGPAAKPKVEAKKIAKRKKEAAEAVDAEEEAAARMLLEEDYKEGGEAVEEAEEDNEPEPASEEELTPEQEFDSLREELKSVLERMPSSDRLEGRAKGLAVAAERAVASIEKEKNDKKKRNLLVRLRAILDQLNEQFPSAAPAAGAERGEGDAEAEAVEIIEEAGPGERAEPKEEVKEKEVAKEEFGEAMFLVSNYQDLKEKIQARGASERAKELFAEADALIAGLEDNEEALQAVSERIGLINAELIKEVELLDENQVEEEDEGQKRQREAEEAEAEARILSEDQEAVPLAEVAPTAEEEGAPAAGEPVPLAEVAPAEVVEEGPEKLPDHYAILGVDRKASQEDIKAAYDQKMNEVTGSEEREKLLRAGEVLLDDILRREYDEELEREEQGESERARKTKEALEKKKETAKKRRVKLAGTVKTTAKVGGIYAGVNIAAAGLMIAGVRKAMKSFIGGISEAIDKWVDKYVK